MLLGRRGLGCFVAETTPYLLTNHVRISFVVVAVVLLWAPRKGICLSRFRLSSVQCSEKIEMDSRLSINKETH